MELLPQKIGRASRLLVSFTQKRISKTSLMNFVVQCIGEAFGIDVTDKEQYDRLSIRPATLQVIFDVFLKTRAKAASTAPNATSSTTGAPQSVPSAEEKAQAEKFKQSGNGQMSSNNYDRAIEYYTKAINLDATNPVYYSNRAAAYSSKGNHLSAISDAEKAIEADPSFLKAYSRLR